MKVSNSKKHLARIISENGGWISLANMAVYGKISGECYLLCADEPPVYDASIKGFYINARDVVASFKSEPFNNWHLTVLYRNEYFHLHPAPDADGWFEWKGGAARPAEFGVLVDVKLANGEVINQVPANSGAEWRHCWGDTNIIAYRLHKPEQAQPEFCESVMGSIPEPTAKPTIEQLAADYRSAKDYADRKQQEADASKADADEKLRVLAIAGEALGLLVSPITTKQEPELVITDWRDLRVGDVIEVTGSSNEGWRGVKGKELTINVVRSDGASTGEWLVRDNTEFRIIRRP